MIGVETDLRGEPDCTGIFIGSGCNSVAAHEKPFGRIFLSKLSDEATSRRLPLRTEKALREILSLKGLIFNLRSVKWLCVLLFLRKDEVEQNGEHEHYCDAVLGEDGLDDVREYVEHLGGGGESEADAEREAGDDHVTVAETALGHHPESGEEDASEHHDRASAKHGLRDGGECEADG